MDTPMQTTVPVTTAAPVSSEAASAAASSSETSPQPTGEGQQAGASKQPIRSTALATAARRNKKRKSAVPDGRSKAVVCDQCRIRKTHCDLKDPCSACGSKGISCTYERTDPVARVEKLQELEARRQAREAALEELQQAAPPGHYDMNTRSGGRTRPARSTQSLYAMDAYDADEYMLDDDYVGSDGGAGGGGGSAKPAPAVVSTSRANGHRTHDTDSGFASSATSSATAAARSKARPALYRPGDESGPSRRHYTNFGSAIIGPHGRTPDGNDALQSWIAARAEAGGGGGGGRYSGPPPLPPIDLTGCVKDSIQYHFPTKTVPAVRDGPWVPGQPLPVASDAFDSPAMTTEDPAGGPQPVPMTA
ncbi:hypothetical protein JCM8115_005001 [Rhodotorula mucilaginosa]|uniref:Zn(2)-C6 fungal-type domain-containing protein n=1 Tax=Rhodotorula mucilaginosa TaxID=5537 RepID=A0A9P6WA25_RHOMI|nr:hypothetical protein C6P46_000065 [Rhodotorula mucilaginosa]TKA57337.1 hypothetical protein B0A53_00563 [Rhodotorula sp. CCFEE 5036]